MTIEKHYVIFEAPGTFYSETTTKEIERWDPAIAVDMAKSVVLRYNSKPYGFRFVTKLEHEPIPDGRGGTMRVESKEIERSGVYYINGTVLDYENVPEAEEVLRSNMRCNDWPLVVEVVNGYKSTLPFYAKDRIVDLHGVVTLNGDATDLETKRRAFIDQWALERSEAT